MTWSFSSKERAGDQGQRALARLTSPDIPEFLCMSVGNIVCTGWVVIQEFAMVFTQAFNSPQQKKISWLTDL